MDKPRGCRVCGCALVVGENWAACGAQKSDLTCRECKAAYSREWRKANPEKARAWQKANPEKERARKRAWKKANLEKVRAWRKANLEKENVRKRAWQKANPEKERSRIRAWQKANPGKLRAIRALRRARKKAAAVHPSAGRALLSTRWILAGFLGVPESDIHLDHIIPLSRGGAHADDNLRLLPKRLNLIKGDKLDEEVTDPEFRAWVFGPPLFDQ